jgi:hypothetical protein
LMWGVVVSIYLVLFFPNILNAVKHTTHSDHPPVWKGKHSASAVKPHHPTFPRAA